MKRTSVRNFLLSAAVVLVVGWLAVVAVTFRRGDPQWQEAPADGGESAPQGEITSTSADNAPPTPDVLEQAETLLDDTFEDVSNCAMDVMRAVESENDPDRVWLKPDTARAEMQKRFLHALETLTPTRTLPMKSRPPWGQSRRRWCPRFFREHTASRRNSGHRGISAISILSKASMRRGRFLRCATR